MDEDEAKSIASAWVRRLEANVLSKVHDNKPHEHRHQNENTVTNAYRDDRLPRSYPPPSPKEKIHSDSTKISATSNLVDLKGDTKTNSILTSLERKPSREQPLNQPSRNSPRTPRIDLDVLRNKRLRHFQNNDSYAVTNGEKEGQNFSESLGSSLQSDSCASNMLQWEPNSCERLEGNSFNGDSWNYNSYSNGLNTQRSDDDDKLRLELWGLRGAVESGQLDINSYLRPARSTDIRQNNINSSNLVNTQNPQDNYSKITSSRDDNYNFTLLKKVNKKEDFPIMNSAEGNLHLMTSMLTIQAPQEGGEGPDNVNAEQDSEEFSLSDLQPSTSFGGAIPQTKKLHKAKEDFTRFSVSKNHPTAPFGSTIPQIEGKLYNGFETSDSESSVNAMNIQSKNRSKSKADMHATKSNKPLKSGRGKQKILNELTEYLDAGRGNKKLNLHHKVESSPTIPHSDKEDLHENHTSAEILLKSSSPIAVHENGFRSRSISPDNHRYISTSAPITYNRVINGSPDDGIGRNAIDGEEERGRFGSFETQVFDHHIPVLAKSCPTCNEVNSKAANWCIECGTALIAVESIILSQEQREDYEEQRQETKKLINEALDCRSNSQSLTTLSKTERELNQDITNLSKEVDKNAGFSNKSLQSNLSSYKRRWLKSSTAWSTYEPHELSKPSSIVKPGKNNEKKSLMKNKESFMDGALRSRSSSDLAVIENSKRKNKVKNGFKSGRRQRTTSATYHSADDYDSANLSINLELTNQKSPGGSKSANHTRPRSAKPRKEKISNGNRPGSARPLFKSPSPLSSEKENELSPSKKPTSSGVGVPHLNLDDLGSYDRILTLIRSQRDSEPVPYLYLPDEIILEIFSSLSNKDLVSCACVCSQFNRIAMDETLWKTIVIRKNRNICDDWLESIGDRRPSSLTITQCSSNKVSSEGLRRLFRKCSESLEEVDFSGCSGGELIGESILLHISVRCFNVVSVDISWTNVSDNGIQELAKNLKRLESLCLNGCQAITDNSLTAVAKQHGESLRIFEVFGCFNITPAGLMLFGSQCRHLQTLNIGQCHKMTDSAVGNLVSHLPEIENLDLRGCKQTRDSAVKKIVRHCPHLKSLVLANCPLITDATLSEISTNLAEIKSLDICGCSLITDAGVRALARNCHKLELLDLSSTGTAVTSKSIVALSNYCSQSLRVLKLSFCSDISVNTVNQVVKNCKKLNLLHLYGCKRIKELDKIKNINENLVIER